MAAHIYDDFPEDADEDCKDASRKYVPLSLNAAIAVFALPMSCYELTRCELCNYADHDFDERRNRDRRIYTEN